jgi:glycosyltransferase involved in cell wall biosynthesis
VTTKKEADLLITTVIPTYNRPEKTLRALASVLNQSRLPDEVIIVDDASNPPFEINSNFDQTKIKLVQHQKNLGVSSARNTGIAKAKGDWIAFLDSDDEWDRFKIEKQVQDVEANPQIKLFYTDEIWLRSEKAIKRKKHQCKHTGHIFEACLKQCFIGASTLLIDKSVFDKVGLFDPSLRICEDYDFWIRASLKHKVHLNREALVTKHGGHEDQLSTSSRAIDYYRLKSLIKNFKDLNLSSEEKDLVLNEIEKKKSILLAGAIKHNNKELLKKLSNLDC